MTSSTRSNARLAPASGTVDPAALAVDPAPLAAGSVDVEPIDTVEVESDLEKSDLDSAVESAGFDSDAAASARRLPEGHADARAAAPEAFDPPDSAAGPSSDDPGTPTGGPGRAPGAGGRFTRHPALALAVRSWRQLTSMRTALLLLFLLALAAVPGSLLPQRAINPMRVEQYRADHPTLGPLLDRFSGFDVFAAPWFAAIYLLLFISLIGCLSSRIRWHARALFTAPPKAPARPGRLPGGSAWTSPMESADAMAAARQALRRRRFRATATAGEAHDAKGTADHSVAAEKGYLRETGNLVFHIALVGLLAAVGFGSWYGYSGTVLVVSGSGFANTIISYDQFNAGQRVDTAKLRPFSLTLDRFNATFQPSGQPSDFRADVTYAAALNAPTRKATIRVNHPLVIGNAKIYLIGHGFAPHFVLRDAARKVVWEANVPCTPRDGMFTSTCTVKIPDTGLPALGVRKEPQQLAFSGVFTPTTRLDPTQGYVSAFPAARAPGLTITGFVGNLHLNEGIPQNVYTVDTRDLRQITMTGPAGSERTAQVLALDNPRQRTLTGLPGGMSLEADRVAEFATFQVKSDPFKGEALLFAVLIIVGLIASLRVRRRRVWVRARPAAAGGCTVEIGGLSRSDADGFAVELAQLTTLVREATGPAGTDRSVPTASESSGAEPASTEPASTEPGSTEPSSTEPGGTAAGDAASSASEREH
ncbi:ResB protein required for cytochrome c biosynthesis [Frankia casuarinae]|uniref:ResB-like n=2 Tax=Frankia TaxID=1854 RepID=Q2JFP6_FRACC|nr:ResB-like [Frankia casuarinae]ETA04395.1 ResB protein required for cytochrome c biosynthesis [Frankia sp. CcI6]EYT89803.1 ResB protein required for cytochrome c biosynthesis [Frankia casuarinae]KDA44907.1 ResB protein required for cytochrome c biosynthesis [Frankia sp. BMG5.23]OAA29810.1 cytochrome c biogenesis protein [Frankia casuarinae]